MRRLVAIPVLVVLGAFGVIQLVPYGRAHDNPPVIAEPEWDSPRTRSLAARACFDCHSNETVWPWYSNVAPLSWQVQNHVEEGRESLNFSTWGRGEQEAGEAAETVADGSMPPAYYVFTHGAARLSAIEKQQLIDGLIATLGTGERSGGSEGEDDD